MSKKSQMTLAEHFKDNEGKKRILSLDGGGIRGALTLGYLKKIEDILKAKSNNPNSFRLCDYFHLIGGTSTGSIIAGALSIGMTVDEIRAHYMKLGGKIFGEKMSWWKPWETSKYLKASYSVAALEKNLKAVFGDIKLGSKKIRTGICIIAKRADTNSTWHLLNHPEGKFFNSSMGKNKDIYLWQAIRASSAAPTYFVPQIIDVGNGQKAAFVDGGVSMANNPSMALLMVATLNGFPYQWRFDQEKISLLSLGTGFSRFTKPIKQIRKATILSWAKNVPNMFMEDATWLNQTFMQWISDSPTAMQIDLQSGTLKGDLIGGKPMVNYLRYNCELSKTNLKSLFPNEKFNDKKIEDLIEMSNAKNRFKLYDIGLRDSKKIDPSHILKL